jgi:predicted exporter
VISSLRETGFSMIYSSTVLTLGFAIFILSHIGGTQALGFLVSFTLFTALLSNLFVLPSLLLTLDRRITTKAFRERLIEILDEEEDIELDDLEIKEPDTRGSA